MYQLVVLLQQFVGNTGGMSFAFEQLSISSFVGKFRKLAEMNKDAYLDGDIQLVWYSTGSHGFMQQITSSPISPSVNKQKLEFQK